LDHTSSFAGPPLLTPRLARALLRVVAKATPIDKEPTAADSDSCQTNALAS
jgi:hypothetical protein